MNAFRLMILIGCALLAAAATSAQVVQQIHAHNDYEHMHPLFDALNIGARSVEADIFLVNGQLFVAHNLKDVKASRSLESLYLDPLRKRIEAHNGSVYGDGQTEILLIDIKEDGETTYPALRTVLEQYKDLLTTYDAKQKAPGAITVILTGNQPPRKEIIDEPQRVVAFDGSLKGLTLNPPADVVPWISGKWGDTFTYNGVGPMSRAERIKLAEYAQQAHAQGRTLRFWGGPDNETMWSELRTAGVDWINTDHLVDARKFLDRHQTPQNPTTAPSGS